MEGGLSPKEVRYQQQFNADTTALLDIQQSMEEEGEEESSEAEAQQDEQRIQEEYQEAVANAQSEEEIGSAYIQAQQQALQASLRALGGGDVEKTIRDQASRILGKYGGNLANAGGSFGFDAWVTYTITYMYIMMRGAISLLVPETSTYDANEGITKTAGKAILHIMFPPYRPLQEPGDFAYFCGACVLTIFIGGTLLTVGGIFAYFIMYLSKVFPGI